MNMKKRAYTEAETAEYIGMSRSFLRQARMTGPLPGRTSAPPFRRIGPRAIRYFKEDLDAFLDQFPRQESALGISGEEVRLR
jgi:predicted DNA-binding transcriptional regulator AlpA